MLFFSFIVCVLFSQLNLIQSRCEKNPLCHLNDTSMTIICDGEFGHQNDSNMIPALSCFPPVNTYLFRNFERIEPHAFKNLTILNNQTILIKLINISIIETEAFSNSLIIPDDTKLSIDIEGHYSLTTITLRSNAFNYIKIDQLRFFNINHFNGRSLFDTNCLGTDLDINNLIFERCGVSGFINTLRKEADVNHLTIIDSPGLVQLTHISLPAFLESSKSLQISNTNLKIINAHTFRAWSLVLEELIISNNSNLEIFPPTIVDGVLMKLEKLDLSYNSIKTLDTDYNWNAYSYTKELLLQNQQLDLFLKSNMLGSLPFLEKIDFSYGFISENNDDLIQKYFPNITKLISIDVSYTNFTENMIINLLTRISQSIGHFTNIRLLGHALTDENFCSYFRIFKNAPNLLNLQLDDQHECNCVIDLFYGEKFQSGFITYNESLIPSCLFNSTRTRCNINTQLSMAKCNLNGQNPDTDDNMGNYAFGAVVGGLTVLVLILLSLGVTVVYRIRRRRNTDLFMEQPVENPLAAIIEERSHTS